MAEAVAIRGNQILRVGSERDIAAPAPAADDGRSTRRAARSLPGFNDAHVHLITGGLNLDRVDLHRRHDARRDPAADQRPGPGASRRGRGSLGAAGDGRVRPGGSRHASSSTAIVSDRPVSAAVAGRPHGVGELAGASRGSGSREGPPTREGGVIVRDPARGSRRAMLRGSAMSLVDRQHAAAHA